MPLSELHGAVVGGAMLGLSVTLLLHTSHRLSGLSSIIEGLLRLQAGQWTWKGVYMTAFMQGVLLFALVFPHSLAFSWSSDKRLWVYAASGVLVGLGTRLANGCTSGHGLCGSARLSPRSFVALLLFMGSGAATNTYLAHYLPPELVGWVFQTDVGGDLVPVSFEPNMPVVRALLLSSVVPMVGFLYAERHAVVPTLATYVSAVLFGAAMPVSGMAKPSKVNGFLILDVNWDPTLAIVMGVAVSIAAVGFFVARQQNEVLAKSIAPSWSVDRKLVIGSLLFGVGFGSTGLCPAPALAISGAGFTNAAFVFLPAMALGMALVQPVRKLIERTEGHVKIV